MLLYKVVTELFFRSKDTPAQPVCSNNPVMMSAFLNWNAPHAREVTIVPHVTMDGVLEDTVVPTINLKKIMTFNLHR